MMVSDLAGRIVVDDSPTWLRATLKNGAIEVAGAGRRSPPGSRRRRLAPHQRPRVSRHARDREGATR